MVNVYDVDPSKLVDATAEELKSIIEQPEWTLYVKTGVHKERNPADKAWWYKRCASILRKVYVLGPIGTSKLRRYYGGRKNRGHKPDKTYKGSSSITRRALQSLEKAELITKSNNERKGRIVSPKGQSFVDKIATKLYFEGKNGNSKS